MNSKAIKAVVTGGAGFIGSHLVDLLVLNNIEVVVIDNLISGNLENLKQHQNSKRVTFHQTDIRDYQKILASFDGVDWVFHLAARGEIVPSINQPIDYVRDNVEGTASVVEAARQQKVKRFVYSASSSCYGVPEKYPTNEKSPIQTKYPYALTKYMGEQMVLHWSQVYKLPSVVLRLGNVYGPRSRTSGAYGAVIGTFLAQKLNGKPYTVVGDGTQKRDFLYVTDCARAFYAAAQSLVSGEIYNVGSDAPQSVNRLMELLGGETDKVYMPKRPAEPDLIYLDTEKIKRDLGWKPAVSFEEGIREVLVHKELWKDAPVWTKESIAAVTKNWFEYLS